MRIRWGSPYAEVGDVRAVLLTDRFMHVALLNLIDIFLFIGI